MDNWSNQFQSLLSSPLGQELLESLSNRRQQLLEEAEAAVASEQMRLLNHAYGVRLAIEHLQFRAIVPKDEGGKD